MAVTVYPRSAALVIADQVRGIVAGGALHLVKESFNPTDLTTLAEMDAIEADYSGYAAKTIAAWGASYTPPEGGAAIRSGEQQFNFVPETPPTPDVTNLIYGWYYTLASEVGPPAVPVRLFVVGTFDNPQPMSALGDATFVNIQLGFGAS